MSERDSYTDEWPLVEADFMNPNGSKTKREWWAFDEIRYLREKVEAIKKDRDEGWHNFMELRRAYAQYRYPGMQEAIRALEIRKPEPFIVSRDDALYLGCTCRIPLANVTDVSPPEPRIDRECPLHGRPNDGDERRDRMIDERLAGHE